MYLGKSPLRTTLCELPVFEPQVLSNKVDEAEKFVLGAAYSGQKFGYLWSLGTGLDGDARGFGKSSLMQYLVENVNEDFGSSIFIRNGLDETDAEEHALCAVLASFDMAHARSLNAVFYEAARYACRFRHAENSSTLVERVRDRLIDVVGDDDSDVLINAVETVQENLRGRTPCSAPDGRPRWVACKPDQRKVSPPTAEVHARRRRSRVRAGVSRADCTGRYPAPEPPPSFQSPEELQRANLEPISTPANSSMTTRESRPWTGVRRQADRGRAGACRASQRTRPCIRARR